MTDTPTTDDMVLEGIQMAIEANAASMILMNARVQMIADHLGLDVSEPPLSEAEEKNKEHMLRSVGQRMQKLMKMGAAIAGTPEPSQGEMADALEQIKDEIWPDGSISGTKPSPTGRIANREPAMQHIAPRTEEGTAIRKAFAGQFSVDEYPTPDPDPFAGSIFEGAEPVDPSEVNMFLDDSTADEDTELMRQAQAAEEPLFKPEFKSTRAPKLNIDPEQEFTVRVWPEDGFTDVDCTDPAARQNTWEQIVSFYKAETTMAVDGGWLDEAWGDRLIQEFMLSPDNPDIDSDLELPEPGDVTQGVAQTAADGDAEISIKGLTKQYQVVEALLTAFMVTAARFNMAIGAALLESRMSQLGLKA